MASGSRCILPLVQYMVRIGLPTYTSPFSSNIVLQGPGQCLRCLPDLLRSRASSNPFPIHDCLDRFNSIIPHASGRSIDWSTVRRRLLPRFAHRRIYIDCSRHDDDKHLALLLADHAITSHLHGSWNGLPLCTVSGDYQHMVQ